MNMRPTWADALNISADDLNAWSGDAPAGQPVLFYALERGLIAGEEYLAWAREHYALPTLNDAFFSDACDLELVRGAHEMESYRPWFFPVGRWDDVIYVACVEPSEELPPGYCQVLADARQMNDVWTSTLGERLDLSGLTVPPIDPTAVDVPAGFATGAPVVFKLDLDNLTMATPEAPAPAPIVAAVVEAPRAPTVPAPQAGTRLATPEVTTARSFYSASPDEVLLNLPAEENAAFAKVFEVLTATFSTACVLRRTDSMIQLYRHSANLTPVDAKAAIDLGYPSFLRIVARTAQPYHGYLVDSPTHLEFFRSLGLDKLPDSVTAVPLMVEEQLWGVLMVTGSREQQTTAVLKPVVSAARQLSEVLAPAARRAAA